MIDLTGVDHHPAIREIVEVLCSKTDKKDRSFFRVEVAYFLAKMATSMRATIITKDRGEMPVNIYTLGLAGSGFGKGHSVNIIEDEITKGFRRQFIENTLPMLAEQHLWEIAGERALRNQTNAEEEFDKAFSEYKKLGAYPFTFDSGTSPAVKQLRQKLLMAAAGSINLQIDEIGSNLIGNVEILNVFLELYDQGLVKQKLTKNTVDVQRSEEIEGKTPTNMLLFGTPAKLFDGGQTEDMFYTFLETGYARRCLFGYGQKNTEVTKNLTLDQVAVLYHQNIDPQNRTSITKWSDHFELLASPSRYNWKMTMDDQVGITLLAYKIQCEQAASLLKDTHAIQRAEQEHRYNKALKLAGVLAFIDASDHIDLDNHLKPAILLVEQSGEAFAKILYRERPHVRLAKYLADQGAEVTQSDLTEALPFYKGSLGARTDMMNLAISYGYKHNIIIKRRFEDGIEFIKAETLTETNLDEIVISYSNHWAYHYGAEEVPFEDLHILAQAEGHHWANHAFKNEHRSEENAIPGFNLVVIDVDGGVSLAACHEMMKKYKFMTYTTKRHSDEENRFRLILPINYKLFLDTKEYKEFMDSVMAWLPFTTDASANQRAKKWESCHTGSYHYNDGELLDALPFIPKTKKNEQFKEGMKAVANLDSLESWFAREMAEGNRNNHMIRFALALVDSGHDLPTVQQMVLNFNEKLSNPLDEDELNRTVLATVAKRYN